MEGVKGGKESNNGDRSDNKYANNAVVWLIFCSAKPMLLPIFCVTTQNQIYIPILTLTISYLIPGTFILVTIPQGNSSNQCQTPTVSLWIDRKNNRTNVFSFFSPQNT